MEFVKIKIICAIILGIVATGLVGCHTTRERLANLGESIHNIALDGDGVN